MPVVAGKCGIESYDSLSMMSQVSLLPWMEAIPVVARLWSTRLQLMSSADCLVSLKPIIGHLLQLLTAWQVWNFPP